MPRRTREEWGKNYLFDKHFLHSVYRRWDSLRQGAANAGHSLRDHVEMERREV
jgi:hypothetical protein